MICPFCKETRNYKQCTQVCIDGDTKYTFSQWVWVCELKDDYCDVFFDERDNIKNHELKTQTMKALHRIGRFIR